MAKNLVWQIAIALVGAVVGSTAAMAAAAQTPTAAGQLLPTSDAVPSTSSPSLRGEFSFTLPSSIAPTLDPVGRGRFEFSSLNASPFPPNSNTYFVTQFELFLYGRSFSYPPLNQTAAAYWYEPFVELPPQQGGTNFNTPYTLNYEVGFDDPTFPLVYLGQNQNVYLAVPSKTFEEVTGSVSYVPLAIEAEPLTPFPVIPTPALLPALIGISVGLWRKRIF